MTTPSTTPTPPADTRQQAADVLLAHFWAVDDRVCLCGWTPVEAAGQWAWLLENDSPQSAADAAWEAVAAEFARHQAAVLVSSSPVLPEPPAPPGRDSAGAYWNVAHGGKVDVLLLPEDDAHRVFVELADSKSNRAYTPYEARLLASTLLAAADVAEEQQP